MKLLYCPPCRSLGARLLAAILLLSFHPTLGFADDSEARIRNGLSAAKVWLALIDNAKYRDSYTRGCEDFQKLVTQDKWINVLSLLRPQLGDLVSRNEISHFYKPNGISEAHLSGECLVIRYDSEFKHVPKAREEVVMKWESGQWRPAGYTAGPDPDAPPAVTVNPDVPLPQTDTESRTLKPKDITDSPDATRKPSGNQ